MSEILGALFKNLVQLLGVAAVGLVLYAVFSSSKTSDAISDLHGLSTETQSLFYGQQAFTVTNAVAITAKLAPERMINAARTGLVNPWGGAVTIRANTTDSGKFDITSTKVPNDACAKMAANTPSIVGLSVNGTVQTLPVDAGAVAARCSVTDNNTLIFTFGH